MPAAAPNVLITEKALKNPRIVVPILNERCHFQKPDIDEPPPKSTSKNMCRHLRILANATCCNRNDRVLWRTRSSSKTSTCHWRLRRKRTSTTLSSAGIRSADDYMLFLFRRRFPLAGVGNIRCGLGPCTSNSRQSCQIQIVYFGVCVDATCFM